MKYIVIGLALLAAACTGTAETRATNALAISCDVYGTVLEELTPLRADGTLSDSHIERINQANELVDPACMPDSDVDPAEAVQTVREGVNLLKTIKETVE